MTNRRLGTLCLLPAVLALAGCMHKAYIAHCDAPRASFTSDVALVLMPYEYAGKRGQLSDGAATLARLTQLQMLGAGMEYDSFGVTLLLPASESEFVCDPLDVEDKLIGRKINPATTVILAESQDLILWWGRVYEQAGVVYVQNSWRVIGRGARPVVHEKRVDGSGEHYRFEGRLPLRAGTFPPRSLSGADLAELQRRLAGAGTLRDAPSPGASPTDTLLLETPSAYSLLRIQGVADWAQIQRTDGKVAYVQLNKALWALGDKLPELHFLQGLIGVLQMRHMQISTNPDTKLAMVTSAFDAYRAAERGLNSESAVLASRLLQGYAELSNGSDLGNVATLRRAEAQFDIVAKALPLNPEVGALSAMARIVSCCASSASEKEQTDIEQMLIRAIVADPTNAVAAANLESYYDYLRAARFPGPFDAQTVAVKQLRLRAFREAAVSK